PNARANPSGCVSRSTRQVNATFPAPTEAAAAWRGAEAPALPNADPATASSAAAMPAGTTLFIPATIPAPGGGATRRIFSRVELVAPPARGHLGVARVVPRAEGDELDPVRTGLDVSHRVLVDPDRVPLRQVDDLVLDLDPARAADDDVDLLLPHVLVTERHAEAGRERDEAQAERLAV